MANVRRKNLLLYAVTSRDWLDGVSLVSATEQALIGGITMLQLRDKSFSDSWLGDTLPGEGGVANDGRQLGDTLPGGGESRAMGGGEEFISEAREIRELCRVYGVPLIVNDSINLAIALSADGVHLGQNDESVYKARLLLGDSAIIGASVQTVEQAKAAEASGADYLGVGAIFASNTKDDAQIVQFQTLCEITESVSIPVVAIGGINEGNVMELSGTGIAGIAAVQAIFDGEDIVSNCLALGQLVDEVFRPVCGVIFDLDGTILDSMKVWENVGRDFLLSLGIKPNENLPERFLKMSLAEAASYLVSTYNLQMSAAAVAAEINQMITASYFDTIGFKGNAEPVLDELYERGIPMCICTATDYLLAESALERLGVRHYFCDIVTIAGCGHTKREPEIFEYCLEQLATPREYTWVVEDALHALQTACAAGFLTIAVYEETFASDQDELADLADVYLSDIREWHW